MRRWHFKVSFFMVFVMLLSAMLPVSLVAGSTTASAAEGADAKKVLMITKTTGYRHASIDQGAKVALPQMAEKHGFEVDITEDAADINAANLSKYDVVFFANTTGNFSQWGFTEQQKQDLMNFIKSGKGYVGAHAATDTGYDWAEYGQMTGGYFKNHPWTQTVKFNVEDDDHPATSHLGASWEALEEVYYFQENPRSKGKHILLSLDMNSVGGDPTEDHPNAWCSPVEKGRMFYTALGHHPETWLKEDFQQHLLGGLQYAWGEATDTRCGESSAQPGLQKVSITKSISMPVGIDIANDGKIFAISLTGKVYEVSQDGDTKEILEIPTTLEGEHGLMGITLDPDFATNNYIYLYYTNPTKVGDKLINHLSRFTYQDGVLNPDSEEKLLDVSSDPSCCHQAGYIDFGPDGKLYLTAGDNGLPTQGPQMKAMTTSQNLDDMRGKILRLNKDGSAPEDNPFYTGDGGARDYVYAYGFRNPYRISFEEKGGKMIIYEGDVGPDGTFAGGADGDFDELNAVTEPGQNFGWPYGIGDKAYSTKTHPNATHVKQIDDEVFAEKFAETKKPIAFYPYTQKAPWGGGGRTAMAGPVYNYTGPNAIPGLAGKFLAYEFTRNYIKAVTTDDNGEIVKVDDFMSGLLAPIDMKLGPDGALYVVEFGSSWNPDPNESITKIFYGKLARKPVVKAEASATSGTTPLTVQFDSAGTIDPDGDQLTYEWDFGDGGTSSEANPSHTFTTNGNYTVTLTVTDSTGKSAVWNTTIIVGNTAPTVDIASPQSGLFFTNGQTVTAAAYAHDAEDGEIACDRITWSVLLLHDDHFHPTDTGSGCQPEFTLFDEGHGPEARISYQIIAEVTDNGGDNAAPLKATDSITFRNKRVQAEDFDADGGSNPSNPAAEGVQIEDTRDVHGGKDVGFIEAKDWIMFKDIDMSSINKMYFRMASESAARIVEVRLDSPTGEKVAGVTAPTTKGWQNWNTLSADVAAVAPEVAPKATPKEAPAAVTQAVYRGSVKDSVYGRESTPRSVTKAVYSAPEPAPAVTDTVYANLHDVYLVFPTGGNNINWVQFASPGDAAPTEADVCTTGCAPATPKPDVTGAYDRTGWKASASDESAGDKADNGIDGDQTTRWSTGTGSQAGMWYQLDMGKVQKISRIVVDHGSHWPPAEAGAHPDYFRGYDLQVSTDGETWTTVASKDTSWNKLVVDESFPAVDARYVKMVNKGENASWWLSIHEMYAFPPAPKSDWTFTHSERGTGDDTNNPSDVKHVIDGKINTRWDSGGNQQPGQWFQVNMGSVNGINEVIVDASGHNQDYARGYTIEVSKDGQNWKQVAANEDNTDVKIVAQFAPVKAQYVRITQTGSAQNWWSIDELDVKETEEPVMELDAALTTDIAGRILEAGDEVKVTVSATDAEDLYAAKLLLNYDSTKFEYVNAAINGGFGTEGETASLILKPDGDKLSMALTALGDAEGHDGDVALVDITFKVMADGAATLIRGSEFSDVNGVIAMLNEDRTVSIALTNPDVDGNAGLQISDLVMVAKAFGKTVFDPKLDINHDGKVNIEDIAYVARKLLETPTSGN
ncbi:ThuA domain-containing protein [Paenibacillus xerothermodurans]|uniref:PKD domain-containing protein n=1 Tax=Paenibacillus xerothermodurans TaxID=1977292 RepID=A0A2W1N849_PAEXE|nr:ThuA domain-containing protein [Paenibacillus xerothermodurans]PZE20024.1 PKD domain-containing protein [Paenibacillus xerothermodurans]